MTVYILAAGIDLWRFQGYVKRKRYETVLSGKLLVFVEDFAYEESVGDECDEFRAGGAVVFG